MEFTGYELLWLIYLYSFLGWCLEVCLTAVRRRHLINRGFLNGPFCMIYGFAAAAFAVFLPELKDNLVFLFLGGMALASFLEYCCGRITERIFHRKWWDYSGHRFQLDGYVCLEYSVLWGIGAVLIMKFGNPFFLALIHLLPRSIGKILLWALTGIVAADAAGTAAALMSLKKGISRLDPLSQNLQRISDTLGGAITSRIQRRMMGAYPNISLQSLLEERRRQQREKKVGQAFVFGYGCSFYKLASLFFIGAFLGDLVETVFVYATSGVLMSRSSVVYGPFSIVWGLGCVMLTAALYRVRDTADRYVFLAGTVLGGAYEYFCSVFTERVFGTVFWDYSKIPFNLGGRINLLYCFFWGIAAVVWLKILYPPLSRLIERIPAAWGKIVCNAMIVFMIVNIALSCMALGRYMQRQTKETAPSSGLELFLDEHFPDQRIQRIYPNLMIVD